MLRRISRRLASKKGDPSLVSFPEGVGKCEVFRNVLSSRDEMLISEEVTQILQRDGQIAYDGATRVNQKRTRNVLVDMYGTNNPYTEIRDYRKKENKSLPGLIWSPTALQMFQTFGAELLDDIPDAGRLVEHHLPGFEMHTEPLTSGKSFLYLNLMSDTVLHFDDEATGRTGSVYLPQRSLMHVSGELRWGWRFGEKPERFHSFVGPNSFRKRVEPDLRLSFQVWKFDGRLVDRRKLQEEVEAALDESQQAAQKAGTFDMSGNSSRDIEREMSVGEGQLGGDLVLDNTTKTGKSKSKEEMIADAGKYKQDFLHVQNVIKEMNARQERGESIDEAFLNSQFKHDQTDLDYGFNPQDPTKTWDNIEAKMRWYNDKVRAMNYGDDSATSGPAEPRPMDTKEALQKFLPEGQNKMDMLKDMNTMMPPSFHGK